MSWIMDDPRARIRNEKTAKQEQYMSSRLSKDPQGIIRADLSEGDYGWKVISSADPETKKRKLSAELANGRLAMWLD